MRSTVFFLKLAALGGAILVSGILISRYDTGTASNDYLATVLEKDRLIRNSPSPKIVLVGGSNLAFGIDSKMIQDSVGMPVVNMGLYAKLGLRYMLAQVHPYVKNGDVIVVVPEYDQFYGNFANGDNTLNTALLYTPSDRMGDFIRSYSIVDVVLRPRAENARRSFIRGAAALAGREDEFFPKDTNPVYNRRSFNQYGDAVAHLGLQGLNPDSIFVKPLPPIRDFNRHVLEELNDLDDKANDMGAHTYFMYPSYIDRSYSINIAAIDSLTARLRAGMRIQIVGQPRDFVYPKEMFFDTRYHLNARGRQLRTARMIAMLRSLPGIAERQAR